VGSGGSILNTSGGDGATSGSGVYLNSVRNVILSGMIINDHPNYGIFGQTVHGFTLDNSRLAGTHGTNVGFDEAVISITGLDGQAVFSNDSISGGIEDNVRILNHGIVSVATDSILFNNVRMGHVNSTSGNTALLVRVADGSTNRVRIRNSTFHGSRGGSMFHLNVVNTATARLALDANTFSNTQTQISGAGGVLITASGTAASVPTLTYNITGNTFRGSRTVALNINKDVGLAVINGNISNNTIGVAATANSGSADGSGIQLRHQGGGTHRATVTNNQIFQYNNYGIILEAGDAVAGGGHGRMDMTVTGNTISNPGTLAFPWNGLHANIGTVTDDAHILCLAASGNSLDNSGTATQDIRLRQRMKTTILLPGYGGSSSDNTAVNNFVKANNGNGANLNVVASNSVGVAAPNGPGNGFTNGSCNAPTL
jgi:large repetitive protein